MGDWFDDNAPKAQGDWFAQNAPQALDPSGGKGKPPSEEYGSTGFEAQGQAMQTKEGRDKYDEAMKGLAPGVLGAGATELGGPWLGADVYFGSKALISPKEVQAHPIRSSAEALSFPALEYGGRLAGKAISTGANWLKKAGEVGAEYSPSRWLKSALGPGEAPPAMRTAPPLPEAFQGPGKSYQGPAGTVENPVQGQVPSAPDVPPATPKPTTKAQIGKLVDEPLQQATGAWSGVKPGVKMRDQFRTEAPAAQEAIPSGHEPVTSEAVKSWKYDPTKQEIHVLANNGRVYIHGEVTPEEAQAFSEGKFSTMQEGDKPSFGKAWKDIRDNHRLVREEVPGGEVNSKPTNFRQQGPTSEAPTETSEGSIHPNRGEQLAKAVKETPPARFSVDISKEFPGAKVPESDEETGDLLRQMLEKAQAKKAARSKQ